MAALELSVLQNRFSVCRLPSGAPLPEWSLQLPFASVTRTEDELSLVCRADLVPPGIECEAGWRAIKVQGPLDFALVGVLASLAVPLAAAGISIFAVSTFETDYLMLKEGSLAGALAALEKAGHRIISADPLSA